MIMRDVWTGAGKNIAAQIRACGREPCWPRPPRTPKFNVDVVQHFFFSSSGAAQLWIRGRGGAVKHKFNHSTAPLESCEISSGTSHPEHPQCPFTGFFVFLSGGGGGQGKRRVARFLLSSVSAWSPACNPRFSRCEGWWILQPTWFVGMRWATFDDEVLKPIVFSCFNTCSEICIVEAWKPLYVFNVFVENASLRPWKTSYFPNQVLKTVTKFAWKPLFFTRISFVNW